MKRTGLLLLPLLLATVGTEGAPLTLGPRYKDESNGFQIQIPRKWEQIPTKFQDIAVLGRWSGKGKNGPDPILEVLRFLKPRETGPASPADALAPGTVPDYRDMLRFQPKDVWEYVDQIFQWRQGKVEVVEDDPEFKVTAKNLGARVKILRQTIPGGPTGRQVDARLLWVLAAEIQTVEESDSTIGVLYRCSVADAEDMVSTFKSSIKRFRVLESDREEAAEEGEEGCGEAPVTDADIFVDSEKKPEQWREARKRKLIPGWDALDTQNYLIVYNKEVKRDLLRNIAKHIEAIRKQVYEGMFPPSKAVTAISVVRVCKDAEEYHRYGGPGGSAGYWARGDEELVFYQDRSNKNDSLRVLYHEAFHQYIHYAVGDVSPHSWFNEGHGDYFAGHNYAGGKFKSAPFRWRTGIIANALGQGTYVTPLSKFLKYTQAQYYANPGLCYAQGWSFVYFLREVEARKITKYKKYWGLLDRYFDAIKRNVATVKENALEGLPETPPDPLPVPPLPDAGPVPAPSTELPRPPGLENPFPGEHPLAGAAPEEKPRGETKSVAGPQITGVTSALDAAVDEAFRGIDLDQLEKDWVEWSK